MDRQPVREHRLQQARRRQQAAEPDPVQRSDPRLDSTDRVPSFAEHSDAWNTGAPDRQVGRQQQRTFWRQDRPIPVPAPAGRSGSAESTQHRTQSTEHAA